MDIQAEVRNKVSAARKAAGRLAILPTDVKNNALMAMAKALEERSEAIIAANAQDLDEARRKGLKRSYLDRLMLDEKRISQMAVGLRQTAALPDPVWQGDYSVRRPNGLEIRRIHVPIGVVGIIYEARPNVTADAAALCLKSGNAVILRGGSEAIRSNTAISSTLASAAYAAGVPEGALQFIDTPDREAVNVMMKLHGELDVIIPRGGAGLIQHIVNNSSVPVIETGTGVCHTFVDASADVDMAVNIAINAKTSHPSVCNAMETLLVHGGIAEDFLPILAKAMGEHKVELRGCQRAREICPEMLEATEEDWSTEYGDLILSVKVVNSIDEAIAHINKYNTGHSETIVTSDLNNANRFQREIDAAAVYVNVSTRFTDGFEFGFGAEIGISTELTSTKYLICGEGQVR